MAEDKKKDKDQKPTHGPKQIPDGICVESDMLDHDTEMMLIRAAQATKKTDK
jgi:hypothetical protein